MKKVIKSIGIIISVVWIALFIVGILSGVALLWSLSVDKCTNFNDKSYSTIEELHEDYKTASYLEVDLDTYPNEIV